ncbi:hypothetical protein ABE205_21480 [Brevibacillus agri]|uniref:hypothetical protein n=1 Tax=Brevibacillus agri TaxID=51101 RepID=UPI0025CAF0C9|nr:hypothetical protein [Brevibacillus agri]MED3501640.1 hypothetical protein [Brevibacillus agri]
MNQQIPMYTYLDPKNAPFNNLPPNPRCEYVVRMLIEKRETKNGNIRRCLNLIDKLERSKSPMKNTLALMFNEYPLSYQELNTIPEVRDWIHKLLCAKPYLFYYLSDFAETKKLAYLSLLDLGEIKLDNDLLFMITACAIRHAIDKGDSRKTIREIEKRIRKSIKEIFC